MNPVLLLATSALAGFLLGFLLARNTWLTFEGRQSRRDMRVIGGLRIDLRAKDLALRETKKRYAGLLGEKRKLARQLREAQYGKSVFSDPTLLAAHMEIERSRALSERLTKKYGPVPK